MYEQRACFFAWLIMPFNSRSTTPLHRIISQWSWLFLLSHALSFFFSLPHCKMNHGSNRLYPGESGELANGLTNHEHRRQTHRRREPFVVRCTHQVRRQLPIWPEEKMKRWSIRRQNNQLHLCLSVFSLSSYIKPPLPSSLPCRLSNQTGQCVFIRVGGRVSAPFIMSSGTMTALLFPARPALSQPPDSSRLAFSPLSPGPTLLSPPAFLSSSPRGPHWEYCSDPGLWAPKPALILRIDRPENFLPSTAGPARRSHSSTLNSQHFSVRETEKKQGQAHYLCHLNRWVQLMWCVLLCGHSRRRVAPESVGAVASPNSVRLGRDGLDERLSMFQTELSVQPFS